MSKVEVRQEGDRPIVLLDGREIPCERVSVELNEGRPPLVLLHIHPDAIDLENDASAIHVGIKGSLWEMKPI